jgi:hypothetical protein
VKSRSRFATFRIDVGYQRYSVLCRVIPGRAAPHVGADSPRFMDPGSAGSVQIIRVLKGSDDVTDALDASLLETLKHRAALAAVVRKPALAAPRRDGQGSLGLEVEG